MNLISKIILAVFLLCSLGCSSNNQAEKNKTASKAKNKTKAADSENANQEVQPIEWNVIEITGTDSTCFISKKENKHLPSEEGTSGKQNAHIVKKIIATPHENIRLKLINSSNRGHNWVLLKKDTNVSNFVKKAYKASGNQYIPPKTKQVLDNTELAAQGVTVEEMFLVPKEKGEYKFLCTYPGHYQKYHSGGTLIVHD